MTVRKTPAVKKNNNIVKKAPDLKLSISFDTPYTWVGKSTKVKFTVINMGSGSSKATQLREFNTWKTWQVPILKRFGNFTRTVTWVPKYMT